MILINIIIILLLLYYLYTFENFKCDFLARGISYENCIDQCENPSIPNLYGNTCDNTVCNEICRECRNVENKKLGCVWYKKTNIDNINTESDFLINYEKNNNLIKIMWNNIDDRYYLVHFIDKKNFKKNIRIVRTDTTFINLTIKNSFDSINENIYLNNNNEYSFFVYAYDKYGLREKSNMILIKT